MDNFELHNNFVQLKKKKQYAKNAYNTPIFLNFYLINKK
jgi:hypothetical protein